MKYHERVLNYCAVNVSPLILIVDPYQGCSGKHDCCSLIVIMSECVYALLTIVREQYVLLLSVCLSYTEVNKHVLPQLILFLKDGYFTIMIKLSLIYIMLRP